jgi:mono/diheme cytochrome c family protein
LTIFLVLENEHNSKFYYYFDTIPTYRTCMRVGRMNKGLVIVVIIAVFAVGSTGAYFVTNNTNAPNPTSTPTATPTSQGAALYIQYCASCHGTLADSARKGYTAEQIQNAIATVPGKQQTLGNLTTTQIQEIADALKVP